MFFSFIDTAYPIAIILLLIAFFFVKKEWKQYCSNLVAVANTILIFYACYLIKSLADLIRFVLSLNIKPDPNMPTPPIGWFEVRYIILILFPFFFIIPKLAKSRLFALLMLVLLQWDLVYQLYKNNFTNDGSSALLFYMPYNVEFKTLHFISLFIGTYALLWLLKRLPSQRTTQ